MALSLASCVHYTDDSRYHKKEVDLSPAHTGNSSALRWKTWLSPVQDTSGRVGVELILPTLNDQYFVQASSWVPSFYIMNTKSDKKPNSSEGLKELGAQFYIEPELRELSLRRELSPVGLIRQAATVLTIQLRVSLTHVKTGNKEYEKIKTVTIEDRQWRWSDELSQQEKQQKDFILENRRKIEEELLQLLKESMTEMSQVAGRLGWEGRVALIQGNKVYLNVGEKSGLRVGDLLRVSQLGDEVYGKETRYVSRARLQKMLTKEFQLLLERLGTKQASYRFFAFADTMATRSSKVPKAHGWLGVMFQHLPGAAPQQYPHPY